jgi:class I fructose-bisphosphate aldolase
LPVDQGFEHGPGRSFAMNVPAYDPRYHFRLAIEAGCSAFAAPLGFIEAGAREFAGCIPLILKVNSHDVLNDEEDPTQAIYASVDDALRLGCAGVGYTIYPGSARRCEMYEGLRDAVREAKARGLVVIVWSYPRGSGLTKQGETATDVTASGGAMNENDAPLIDEARAIREGGGFGTIMGRNVFQRREMAAKALLTQVMDVFGS